MSLTIDDVRRIADEAARETSRSMRVAGVTLGGAANSEYAEIMVIVEGCGASKCVIELRTLSSILDPALRSQLARAMRAHLAEHDPAHDARQ
jgi:hypothetical protein